MQIRKGRQGENDIFIVACDFIIASNLPTCNKYCCMKYYFSESNIGSIAICGSEKTVIFTYDNVPPGKTYPIGASGAIISDIMDDNESEYLCCFLAKDKRMVVFELYSKIIVVSKSDLLLNSCFR